MSIHQAAAFVNINLMVPLAIPLTVVCRALWLFMALYVVSQQKRNLPYIKNIIAHVYFCSLMCPVFLGRRIDDFHCPDCPIYLSYLTCLSIGRWDRLMDDFHSPVMF